MAAASQHRWHGFHDFFALRPSSVPIGALSAAALEFIGTTSMRTFLFGPSSRRRIHPVKITRQTVADKITDYLHGKLSQAELVSWGRARDDGRRI
jgi:hypothetical protein